MPIPIKYPEKTHDILFLKCTKSVINKNIKMKIIELAKKSPSLYDIHLKYSIKKVFFNKKTNNFLKIRKMLMFYKHFAFKNSYC